MMTIDMTIQPYSSVEDLAQGVANLVVQSAKKAIDERGVFHWALAGGTSPKLCYECLSDAAIDWQKVHVWFGDERCLPVGDVERNDDMADQALLNHVSIPESNIHRIHAEWEAQKAAQQYCDELSLIPCLDLVLLGMGEDGHTASLFPNNPALLSEDLAVAVYHSPKPPSDRVSMGYKTLKAARQRVMMVTGEGKRDVFEKLCSGGDFPISIDNSDWHTTL
ncbi:MAG: 6-phosphogluconolactonase [Mariprofundaceae bacterium]|nr:6-phosphogluconolactonase [Mariprofundaceae bacterium]